jgi:hypothetical protein
VPQSGSAGTSPAPEAEGVLLAQGSGVDGAGSDRF